MRKIINNRAYDTTTSRLVGEVVEDSPAFRGRALCGLYRKRTGEYFLCVTDAGQAANERSSGDVTPLDYESARRWAESYLDDAAFGAEFGEAPDDDQGTVLSVRVSTRAERVLEQWCSRTGEAKGATVDRIIIECLS